VASTVALCPSGALRYTRTSRSAVDDAGSDPFDAPPPAELSADAVTITVHRNGPYEVRGPSHVVGSDGGSLRDSSRVVYLCRCGGSGTKPFCDGSHNRNGFSDEGLGPA
jgi:CDGSH-type Zn-finger protein